MRQFVVTLAQDHKGKLSYQQYKDLGDMSNNERKTILPALDAEALLIVAQQLAEKEIN